MRFHDLHITKIWDRLFQGCYDDALGLLEHNPRGITFVLNCTPEPIDFTHSNGIESLSLPIDDGVEIEAVMFSQAMNAINYGLRDNGKVLIHCHAGISRSTVVLATWMSRCGFGNLDDCVKHIEDLRPVVTPHPAVLVSAKKYLKEFPYDGSYTIS